MKRILIADDKESSREFVRTVLEHAGCDVEEAADGLDALAKISADPPDLVVLDLHMPGFDGFAVMEDASTRRPVSIVASSSADCQRHAGRPGTCAGGGFRGLHDEADICQRP